MSLAICASSLTGNANFLALTGLTTINNSNASFRFDGVDTDVSAVPEPAGYALLLAGLVVLCDDPQAQTADGLSCSLRRLQLVPEPPCMAVTTTVTTAVITTELR